MIKIAIAGAGVGGVVCAYYLARSGYDVTVYERRSVDTVTYPWHDDIAIETFEALGLPQPDPDLYFAKRNWTFVPPYSERHVYANLDHATDMSVDRRGLLHWLVGLAREAGVTFAFDTEVSLWLQQDAVRGLLVGEDKVEYALVVDSTGLYSPLRKALPNRVGTPFEIDSDDVFCAWRGFYARNAGVEVDDHETNRVYLLHDGAKGISWCLADPTRDSVDVLIGRVGSLNEDERDQLFGLLQQQNPILGDKLVGAGQMCRIPVRRPLDMLVWDGYAVLGDAACMTIPMLGSGMASSMLAGKLLAETVIERQSVSKEALWHYQTAWYRQCGAQHCGVDVLKRWLLSADPKDVRWLFESGVLREKDINEVAAGRIIHLSVGDLVQKLGKGIGRMGLLLTMARVLGDCNKAVKRAMRIPNVYDANKIAVWRDRLEQVFAD